MTLFIKRIGCALLGNLPVDVPAFRSQFLCRNRSKLNAMLTATTAAQTSATPINPPVIATPADTYGIREVIVPIAIASRALLQ